MTDVNSIAELNNFLATHKYVLVDFHATWCGPCKMIAPYVVKECAEKNVALAKVDVDQAGDVAQKYGISAMPTFKVLDASGNVLLEKVGGGQKNVDACISEVLSRKG